MRLLDQTISGIGTLDANAMQQARERLDTLLKPRGSLGKLEEIAVQLAGITGNLFPDISKKTIIVMIADNGVFEEGVASYPQKITAIGAGCLIKGMMGVNVLARHAGAGLKIVDIGIREDVHAEGLIVRKIRPGTANIALEAAMTREEAVRAIETGIETAFQAIDEGADIIGTGEMGIANTTTSSAVLYALTGKDIDALVGRGAGLDDEGLMKKKNAILRAVKRNNPDPADPVDVISKVGGLDIAGLTGVFLACASRRRPVLIDGFISSAAALAAIRLKPEAKSFMIPSHCSMEPGAGIFFDVTGLEPMLRMNMRLGEGTGCALAFHIVEAAVKIIREMGTFGDIGM